MKTKAKSLKIQFAEDGTPEITLTLKGNRNEILRSLSDVKEVVSNGKDLSVEIKQYRERRSLDANAYCWVLCQKIAEVVKSTKEEVYRRAIKDVGQFEILPIKAEAVERWMETWASRGLGWFAEVMDDSKLPGYKKIISYYGSSIYDSKEMSVLVDWIVQEAKEIGVETLTPAQLEQMKKDWR